MSSELHRASSMEIILRFGLLVYVMISVSLAAPIQTRTEAEAFLSKYGYLSAHSSFLSYSRSNNEKMTNAIKEYQTSFSLPSTGELDSDTLELMSSSRCGVKDNIQSFVLTGSRHDMHVTYRIKKYSKRLNRETVDEEIKKAFEVWSAYTDLKFTQRQENPVDIEIQFEEDAHYYNTITGNQNCEPFDGQGDTLAHADKSFVHFDDAESWTVASMRGTSLFKVAAHEIGHSLGLLHSHVPSALMYPYYSKDTPSSLHDDDIKGIQHIYGVKTEQRSGQPKPQPESSEEDSDQSFPDHNHDHDHDHYDHDHDHYDHHHGCHGRKIYYGGYVRRRPISVRRQPIYVLGQQTYPQQTYAQQTHPQQTYPQQTYTQQTYPQQTYTQLTYPQQTYSQLTYPQQTYPQHTIYVNPYG